MKSGFVLLTITASSLLACSTSQRTSGSPEPTPAIEPSPSVSSGSSGPWTISPAIQEGRYRSIESTLLEFADSAGITRDSMQSTVDFTLSVNPAHDALSYSATIDSMSVRGGQRTGSVSPGTRLLPFSFTGRLQQGRLSVDLQAQTAAVTDCSNEALSTVAKVQRTLIPVPFLLQKDMAWTDSTVASVCSGSIPTTHTTHRRYKVIGETGKGLLIEEQDKTLSTGEGTQGQHRVRLRTDGTGMTHIVINPQTGGFIESSGTHTTSVVVTASGRDHRFTQTTREQISQRN